MKTPGKILWEDLEPAKGSPLAPLVASVREKMATLAELERLLEERQKQLVELQEQGSKELTAESDPFAPAQQAAVAEARLAEIVQHIKGEISRLRMAMNRPKLAAEEMWYRLLALEKDVLTHEKQAETLEGRPADVAAGHAQRKREDLERLYREYTGREYQPIGAVVTWEYQEPTALQKAITAAGRNSPRPSWAKKNGDKRQASTVFAEETEWDEEARRQMEAERRALKGESR